VDSYASFRARFPRSPNPSPDAALQIAVDSVKRRTLPHAARSIPISLHMLEPLEASFDVTSTIQRTVALRHRGECDERGTQRTSEHRIREPNVGSRTAP
jgi:hypothetical protein